MLRRGVAAGWQLEIWLGRVAHARGLRWPPLPALSQSYAFAVARAEGPGRLRRGALRKLWLMSNLVFASEAGLDARVDPPVYPGGSSDYGHAPTETDGLGD